MKSQFLAALALVGSAAAALAQPAQHALPARAHDPDESLNAKVELMKFMGRLAGMEAKGDVAIGASERFSLTINIGEGQTMKIVPTAPQLEAA